MRGAQVRVRRDIGEESVERGARQIESAYAEMPALSSCVEQAHERLSCSVMPCQDMLSEERRRRAVLRGDMRQCERAVRCRAEAQQQIRYGVRREVRTNVRCRRCEYREGACGVFAMRCFFPLHYAATPRFFCYALCLPSLRERVY